MRPLTRLPFVLTFIVAAMLLSSTAFAAVCAKPSGSLSYTPDATGQGVLAVTYGFSDAGSGNFVQIWIDGSIYTTFHPSAASGSWSTTLSSACWRTGTHYIAVLFVACDQWWNEDRKTVASLAVETDTTPTLSGLTYNVDSQGHGSVSVNYAFPNTNAESQHGLQLWVDGQVRTTAYVTSQTGTWTTPLDSTCWTTGAHSIDMLAFSCGHWDDAAYRDEEYLTVDIDTKPKVTNVAATIDGAGICTVSANYQFPNTDAPEKRWLQVWIDGAAGTPIHMQEQSGVWSYSFDTSCMSNGEHAVGLLGIACGNWADPRYKDDQTTTIVVDHNPVIDAAEIVLPAAPDTVDLRVEYRFPQTNSALQRSITLSWLPSSTTPASTILTESAPEVANEKVFSFTRPAHGELVKITLNACTTDEVSTTVYVPGKETTCVYDQCKEPTCVGDPIHISSANMRYTDHEPLPGDLAGEFGRTYDSSSEDTGVFGAQWTTPFDAWLRTSGSTVVIGTRTNGRAVFEQNGSVYTQTWPTGGVGGTLVAIAGGALEYRASGSSVIETYSNGRLVALQNARMRAEAEILYDASGRPTTVRDAAGRWQWNITTDPATSRITSIAVDGRPDIAWQYVYDAGGRLASVLAPGSETWRTYEYNGAKLIAARDAAGKLRESHDYAVTGQATTSIGPSGDISAIVYGIPGRIAGETATRVTSSSGRVSTYYLRYIAGRARTVEVDGGCTSCGTDNAAYVYDGDGNIVREQSADGYITQKTYTAHRLVNRRMFLRPANCEPATASDRCRQTTDTLATLALTDTAATVETQYEYADANWPERATSVRTRSVVLPDQWRTETSTFDAASGQTLVSTVTGVADPPPGETSEIAPLHRRQSVTTLYNGAQTALFSPGGTFAADWLVLPQPNGRQSSVATPNGSVTQFVYYPMDSVVPATLRGRLAAVRNAAGQIARYESYDVFGNVTRQLDANGVATTLTYDALGRLVAATLQGVAGCDTTADALCATDLTTTRAYAGAGPLVSETRAGGGVTAYEYDERGRMQSMSRGPSLSDLRERVEYAYDPATGQRSLERLLAREGASWVETKRETSAYDSRGRLATIMHPDGTSIAYTYDAQGRIASIRDENHGEANTLYSYDPAGRLAAVSQKLGSGTITTHYAYDTHGNLRRVTDPNANVTEYAYDDFGQMVQQTSPVTGTTTYAYDDAGNLIAMIDANGATTTRTYDALNRVLIAESAIGGATETVTWSYDASVPFGIGRLRSMTDPLGTANYRYDRRGLLLSEERGIGNRVYASAFRYDQDGTRSAITYPSGSSVQYGLDYAGRPLSLVANGVSIVATASYAPFGPLTEQTFGNGTTRRLSYDTRYRVLRNELTAPGGRIAGYDYATDGVGNITEIHDLLDATYDRDFGYDDVNRLTVANTGTSLWGNGTYAYDAMGNMTASALGTFRSQTFSYVGTTPKIQAVGGSTPLSVTYDAAGNETQGGRTYSARNYLSQVQGGTPQAPVYYRFAYDGRGVRTRTETQTTGPQSQSSSVVSLYLPELRLLSQSEPSSPGATEPDIAYDILWFNDHPVAQIFTDPTAGTRYTFTDHLGTPLMQLNGTTLTWRAEYEPYGNVYAYRTGSPASDQPLRFPGQELAPFSDDGTEQRYNIFRWYRSGWGRYTQSDPAMHVARSMMIEQDNVFDLPNMITFFLDYTYAAARPTTLDDPNGLGPIPGFGKFKIDKSCTKKICSQFYPLDEDVDKPVGGPAPPLSKPLAPGGSMSVDGVYWPGAILKIPNNCNATLVCDKKGVAHFEFNCITWPFKDKPQKFINGTPPPPPPGWPSFL